MSNLLVRTVHLGAAGALLLAAAAGCAKSENPTTLPPAATASATPEVTTTADPEPTAQPTPPKNTGGGGGGGGSSSSWPSPADCVSYNTNNLTVFYDSVSDKYNVMDGSSLVIQLFGDEGPQVGEQGLALAKRYKKVCYLGRNNTRTEERGSTA